MLPKFNRREWCSDIPEGMFLLCYTDAWGSLKAFSFHESEKAARAAWKTIKPSPFGQLMTPWALLPCHGNTWETYGIPDRADQLWCGTRGRHGWGSGPAEDARAAARIALQ